MTTEADKRTAVFERYLGGVISAPIALMELLLATPDAAAVARAVASLTPATPLTRELRRLADEHAEGCATIVSMLQTGLDSPELASSVDEGIDRARRLFDASVLRSEESSVALYSLGSPELLAAATDEAVAVLDAWRVLGPDRTALEIGCGIGRFLVPLSKRLKSIVGVDVSPNMIEAARRRTRHVPNVELRLTAGRDLDDLAADTLDLVFSVDAFPYLVIAGRALVEAHLAGASRALRSGGDLVIFNYAYGRRREDDAAELQALGEAVGLVVVRSDETPFKLWNAVAFHLRRG